MRTQLGRETAAKGSRVIGSMVLLLASTLLAGCGGSAAGTSGNPSASSASSASAPSVTTTSPTSKSAEVSWSPPTTNTNGSALTDLAGYRIYYGTTPQGLNQTVNVPDAGATDYVIASLPQGTWYFAVVAYTNSGLESALSSVASKTIS